MQSLSVNITAIWYNTLLSVCLSLVCQMNATKNLVVLSVNLPGNDICVDIFKRVDGTFGFEEFRRDHEDGRGWFAIGYYSLRSFNTLEEAKSGALETVGWLHDVLGGRELEGQEK